jgi:nitrite reductase (NADH) small subunit
MHVSSGSNGVPRAREANDNQAGWADVCALEDIVPQTGVCALFGKKQVAVFRVTDGGADQVFALSNFDPFSKAFVLSRGIVGDRAGVPKVASPVFKQSFDLRTGQCLDDPAVSVQSYPARVRAGRVEVLVAPGAEKPQAS